MEVEMKALIEQSDGYEKILSQWQKTLDSLTPCIIITKEGKVISLEDAIVKVGLLCTKYHGDLNYKDAVKAINNLLTK